MPLSTLNFYGFEPGQEARELLGLRISQIMDEAPSDAAVVVSFQSNESVIEGVFSIHSSAGAFKTKVSGLEFEDVMEDLVKNIQRQLKQWRKERFSDNSPA